MTRRRWPTRTLVVALLVLLLAAATPAGREASGAPATPTQEELLSSILTEVRMLRQTVERSAQTGIRVQIALQRLSVQDQQVRTLSEQASQLEAGAASTLAELERARAELSGVEERLAQESEPTARRTLYEQRNSLREIIARETAQEQAMQQHASETTLQLNTEKAKLDELSRVLDELARSLERR